VKSYESLNHTKWECKYHVVLIPKCRRKALYGELRKHLGEVFHDLAKQRESKIEQGNLVIDHVHMLISIPPKYSLAQVIGFIKGKSAIHIARTYVGRRKNFTGHHFWARGYFVSTVATSDGVAHSAAALFAGSSRRLRPFSAAARIASSLLLRPACSFSIACCRSCASLG
jgi:putative transposase